MIDEILARFNSEQLSELYQDILDIPITKDDIENLLTELYKEGLRLSKDTVGVIELTSDEFIFMCLFIDNNHEIYGYNVYCKILNIFSDNYIITNNHSLN